MEVFWALLDAVIPVLIGAYLYYGLMQAVLFLWRVRLEDNTIFVVDIVLASRILHKTYSIPRSLALIILVWPVCDAKIMVPMGRSPRGREGKNKDKGGKVLRIKPKRRATPRKIDKIA